MRNAVETIQIVFLWKGRMLIHIQILEGRENTLITYTINTINGH